MEEESSTWWYDKARGLSLEHRWPECWSCLCRALEIDPHNVDALVAAADNWRLDAHKMGFADHSEHEAAQVALGYCDTALDLAPAHADAWGIKAHVLLTLGRYDDALAAAERGLAVLPDRVGAAMDYDKKYWLVGEEVYDAAIRALLVLGRIAEARKVLEEALAFTPNRNRYMENLIAAVAGAEQAGT
jgi:tetratricopeptide (TPR) repeat protein